MEFLKDLLDFLKERKKWWLIPIIISIILIGLLLIFAESSPIAPFVYPLFWNEKKFILHTVFYIGHYWHYWFHQLEKSNILTIFHICSNFSYLIRKLGNYLIYQVDEPGKIFREMAIQTFIWNNFYFCFGPDSSIKKNEIQHVPFPK